MIFEQLRAAVRSHDDWPTHETRGEVIAAARSLVQAVEERAAAIEYMRRHVTPTDEAIADLMGVTEESAR